MNKAQEIAQKRKDEILSATKRMQAKIKAGHHRSEDYKKRLAEYDLSMELIEFTLKTGRTVKLKGEETAGGVVVSPSAGTLNMEGK